MFHLLLCDSIFSLFLCFVYVFFYLPVPIILTTKLLRVVCASMFLSVSLSNGWFTLSCRWSDFHYCSTFLHFIATFSLPQFLLSSLPSPSSCLYSCCLMLHFLTLLCSPLPSSLLLRQSLLILHCYPVTFMIHFFSPFSSSFTWMFFLLWLISCLFHPLHCLSSSILMPIFSSSFAFLLCYIPLILFYPSPCLLYLDVTLF